MNEAFNFLTALAQALSTMNLYAEGHPAREKAVRTAHERLQAFQEVDPTPTLTFLGSEIIYQRRPLAGFKHWDWGGRLANVGIQRVEFTGPVEAWDLEMFLDEALALLSDEVPDTAEQRQSRPTHIRWGTVGLEGQEGSEGVDLMANLATATLGFSLLEEVESVEFLHGELRDRNRLHLLEAEGVVRSLSVAMHGDQQFMIPLLQLKNYDQYTTTHAMNVGTLAMALSEYIGLGPREVRAFGIAGLLHDLGKVRIPDEILNKPGKLTDSERQVMNNHTVEGARIIMETEEHLDLAAVVAYEHHIKLNGGGYPTLTYPRQCHQASNLVHVCDVFDALRTERPYRAAWDQERVLSYIEEGVGTEFDPEAALPFVRMIRKWSDRIAVIQAPDEALPLAAGGTGGAKSAGGTNPTGEGSERG